MNPRERFQLKIEIPVSQRTGIGMTGEDSYAKPSCKYLVPLGQIKSLIEIV